MPLYVARSRLAGSGSKLTTTAYFGSLGVGFIFVELGMMQRFGLLSGSPTAAFVAVVGTLLVASGIGAHISGRQNVASTSRVAFVAACTIAVLGLASAPLADAMVGAAWPARVGVMILILGPMGAAMGMLFPLGIRRLTLHDPALLAYAWGVNGFASVLGSVMCLIVATSLGFTAVLVTASVVYLCAAIAARGWAGSVDGHAGAAHD